MGNQKIMKKTVRLKIKHMFETVNDKYNTKGNKINNKTLNRVQQHSISRIKYLIHELKNKQKTFHRILQ